MDKIYGASARQDSLEQTGRKKWCLIYGFGKDDETQESGWNYRKTYDHKPSLAEIKNDILEQINADIDATILQGCTWNDMPIWLSTENQFNYKVAYDLAVQSDGASLPVTFKFGSDEAAQYHEFTTLEELADFYTHTVQFVQQTLSDGWTEKESIDWSKFDTL